MQKVKILLCGYHWVGCEVLSHILQRNDVADVALLTHDSPDCVPDVRKVAEKNGVWHSVESINTAAFPFRPEIISLVYYRHILSKEVIESVDGRCFNAHPSLLPEYRGCSSVPWAIINGEKKTGITFHYIDPSIDTGNILVQSAISIADTETQATLYQRCMQRVLAFWPAAFELVKAGFVGVPQEPGGTYYRRGVPAKGQIDDSWSDAKVERFIRAMIFPPYPAATYNGHVVETMEDYISLRQKVDHESQ